MSVEHAPRPSDNHERSTELDKLANERREELTRHNPEQAAEHAENRANEAREVIKQQEQAPEPAAKAEQATPAPTFVARLDHALNYTQTMASIQRKLAPASRNFSKVIHTPIIEKTSEVLEKTVMRPSIINGATWSAAIVGLVFYLTARYYGWQLSGSEMLLALIGGALLGLALEGITRLFKRAR